MLWNMAAMLVGFAGLTKFTQDVRIVQVIGLFASGALCGVSLAGLIAILRTKEKQVPST
jgi:hypothetical protein